MTALELFTEYFVKNYPGPDTVIHDPKWHAPKIFRAVEAALREAAPVAETPELMDRVELCRKQIAAIRAKHEPVSAVVVNLEVLEYLLRAEAARASGTPTPQAVDLCKRITDYLNGGGLFNPEMAIHDAVRDLLIDCRAELAAASPAGEGSNE